MKKNHRVLFVMALAVVGLLASCNKNNGDEYTGDGFRATIEQPGGNGGSRTHINPENWNDGTTWPVLWTEGDKILVNKVNAGADAHLFQLQSGANTNDGIFMPAGGEEFDYESGPFCAVYSPDWSNMAEENPDFLPQAQSMLFDGTTALVSLPTGQRYKANSFAEGAMPMVAYSDGQTLQFKNLAGGLCFPIVGEGFSITSIDVESLDSNDKVSGYFQVDCTDETYSLTNSMMGSKKAMLVCSESVALSAEPTYFTVMVAPGTLEKGFTVKAYDGSTVVYEKTVDWSADPKVGFIQRGVIRKLNENLQIVPSTPRVDPFSPSFITTNSAYLATNFGHPDDANEPYTCGFIIAKAEDLANPREDLVLGGNNVMNIEATMLEDWGYGGYHHANITGLEKDQVYWVRGYTKLDDWDIVGYTPAVPFATRKDYANDYDGLLPGVFSVAPDKQVRFSMGNLQYRASTNTWRFAEYQFEYVDKGDGDNRYGLVYANGMHPDASLNGEKSINSNRSDSYDQWIDLFAWGTSGYNHGAVCYQPWQTTDHYSTETYAYGDPEYNLNSSTGQADWGYNAIANGGNTENSGWRTLQGSDNGLYTDEWDYLLNSRSDTYRYAFGNLIVRGVSPAIDNNYDGIKTYSIDENTGDCYINIRYDISDIGGIVLFPDGFEWPSELGTSRTPWAFNGDLYPYSDHGKPDCLESTWSILEHYGAVFLPSKKDDTNGRYWSSTSFMTNNQHRIDCAHFVYSTNFPNTGGTQDMIDLNSDAYANIGSVRLVKDVTTSGNFNNQPFGVTPNP